MNNTENRPLCYCVTGSPGAEFHVEIGYTDTIEKTKFNIFDIVENFYIKIMEWYLMKIASRILLLFIIIFIFSIHTCAITNDVDVEEFSIHEMNT